MSEHKDLLQEKLAQLEAGKPLEACLDELPAREAALVELAWQLHQLSYPERAAPIVAEQRQALIQLIKERKMNEKNTKQTQQSGRTNQPLWYPIAAVAGVFALLAICGVLVSALIGVAWWQGLFSNTGIKTADKMPEYDVIIEATDPESGVLNDLHGLVEVQEANGVWSTGKIGQSVSVSQRIRTGELSSTTLVFYDGSQAFIGPNTEVSIEELNAQVDGPRQIVLMQWVGQTNHNVVHSDDPASRYEVRTPTSSGEAQGTSFSVLVTTTLLTRFNVDEGAVAVTAKGVTVIVVAGHSTTVNEGSEPSYPLARISGQGEVTQVGAIWAIAGQTFLTDASTAISGNPQVGDWVIVEGRILPDGTRFADTIILLRRSPENTFSLVGTVDATDTGTWTISGQGISVNEDTSIESEIVTGDLVAASGVILDDGTFLAEVISLVDDEDLGQPFEFTGVAESMGDTWTISGVVIATDADTSIEGGIEVGDVVEVAGWILDDGTWLATSIEQADDDDEEHEFDFSGTVESIDPWNVSGIGFDTATWTEIEAGIEVDSLVTVKGQILDDGTWLASEISLVDDDEGEDGFLRFEIVGVVDSMEPWVVAGIAFTVDENTQIDEDISIGDTVLVTGIILSDQSEIDGASSILLAEIIVRVDEDDEQPTQCLNTSAIVRSIESGQIVLFDWTTVELDEDIEIEGKIDVASVIIIQTCVDEDDHTTIVIIIVIYQLAELPDLPSYPSPGEGHDGDDDDDDD